MKLFMCCSGEKSRSKDNSKDLGTGDPFNAGKQRRKAQHGHNARANLLLSCFGLVVYVADLLQTFYGETGLMEFRIPVQNSHLRYVSWWVYLLSILCAWWTGRTRWRSMDCL